MIKWDKYLPDPNTHSEDWCEESTLFYVGPESRVELRPDPNAPHLYARHVQRYRKANDGYDGRKKWLSDRSELVR